MSVKPLELVVSFLQTTNSGLWANMGIKIIVTYLKTDVKGYYWVFLMQNLEPDSKSAQTLNSLEFAAGLVAETGE